MGRLDGKVALISGGASGIGEASARLFVSEGASVIIADIQDKKGKNLSSKIGSDYIHMDVSIEDDVINGIEFTKDRYGRLDCIFNNAGIAGAVGELDSVTVEMFDKTLSVNLRGVYLGTKYAARVMREQGSGSIINTSSIAAIRTGYGNHIYSASKAGVLQFTKSVAMELAEYNIRANCILPGFIPTPMIAMARGISVEEADSKIPDVTESFELAQPIKRAGSVDDIAYAALWLASDESKFVTGHGLIVDGGVTGGRNWREYMKAIRELDENLELG
jgi:NAD(P)-dependent dehydrogenase (short-subunit alcohol dehydrogenase family)